MNNFLSYLIGPTAPALFAASLVYAGLGILFVLLLGTRLRKPDSPNSPVPFSWSYLWSDNARRIYASLIAVVVTIRFYPDIFGGELDLWKAFAVGTAWDGIALFIKQKTNWLDPKQ